MFRIAMLRIFHIRIRMDRLDWNLMRAFCATADAGSLSAAARRLGLTQPTVSRQIAALESDLGVALFERIGKRLVLTTTAVGLLEHARAMSAAADAMALAAAGQAQEIAGRVCISATDAFSAYVLPESVARIRQAAPQITVAIVATDSISDLRRREADIAIRHVRPTEPELIARLVVEMKAGLYASQSWVDRHGMPRAEDLAHVELMAFEPIERFVAHLAEVGIAVTTRQCSVVSENAVVLWEMVRRGLGVGVVLCEVADRIPELVRLLPALPTIPVPVWLVTHRELHTSRRVRVVFDILAQALSDTAAVRGGKRHGRKIAKR
jgi:DNA-binding transcriptional LysR family regulator